MATKKLPEKRRRFVEAYMGEASGNATEAARLAGYRFPHPEGSRLLSFATVREAIDERIASDPLVMSREQRQLLLTRIAKGIEPGMIDKWARIKALDMLGRMHGDFVERLRVEHEDPHIDLERALGLVVTKPAEGEGESVH